MNISEIEKFPLTEMEVHGQNTQSVHDDCQRSLGSSISIKLPNKDTQKFNEIKDQLQIQKDAGYSGSKMKGRLRNEECQLQGQTAEFNEKEIDGDEERPGDDELNVKTGNTLESDSERDQIDLKNAEIELQTSSMNQKFDKDNFKSILAESRNDQTSDEVTEKASEVQISTEVFCWGDNTKGQLGIGDLEADHQNNSNDLIFSVPKCCSFNISIRKIACGLEHTSFITPTGFLYSMGSNKYGQLGIDDPSIELQSTPVLVQLFVGKCPIDLACGDKHTVVLSQQGVYSWGANQCGQTGGGDTTRSNVVYSPRLVNFESYFEPNIIKIDCGADHSAFIDDIGRLFQCGQNHHGQLGIGTLKAEYSPVHVSDIKEAITQVAAGVYHSVALTNQGKIYVMGSNLKGQLGVGEEFDDQPWPIPLQELAFTNIIDVRAGSFSAALSSENQFYVWGMGSFGNFSTPRRIKSFNKLDIRDFKISRGASSFVLTQQGVVYSWGDNSHGQLGLGKEDFDSRSKPTKVQCLDNRQVSQIAVGNTYVLALGKDIQQEIPRVHVDAHTKNTSGATSQNGRDVGMSSVFLRENSGLVSIDQPNAGFTDHSFEAQGSAMTKQRTFAKTPSGNLQKSRQKKKLLRLSESSKPNGNADDITSAKTLVSQQSTQRQKSMVNLNDGIKQLGRANAEKKSRRESSFRVSQVPTIQTSLMPQSPTPMLAPVSIQVASIQSPNADLQAFMTQKHEKIGDVNMELQQSQSHVQIADPHETAIRLASEVTLQTVQSPVEDKPIKFNYDNQKPEYISKHARLSEERKLVENRQRGRRRIEENKQSFGEIEKIKSHAYGTDKMATNNHSKYRRGLEATELQERRWQKDHQQTDQNFSQIQPSNDTVTLMSQWKPNETVLKRTENFDTQQTLEQSKISQHRETTYKSNNYRDYVERRENSRHFNESLSVGYESKYMTKKDINDCTLAKKPQDETQQNRDEFQFTIKVKADHNNDEKSHSRIPSYVKSRDHSGRSEQGHERIAEMRIKREESARQYTKVQDVLDRARAYSGKRAQIDDSMNDLDRKLKQSELQSEYSTHLLNSRLNEMRERSPNLTPAEQLQLTVKNLMREKEELSQKLESERKSRQALQEENIKLKEQAHTDQRQKIGAQEDLNRANKELHFEIERLNRLVLDFEDRLEQQKAVKETLRRKVQENEQLFHEMADKKMQATDEAEKAWRTAKELEKDVDYLTRETTLLLDDLQAQQRMNIDMRDKLNEQQTEYENKHIMKSQRANVLENDIRILKIENKKLAEEAEKWQMCLNEERKEKQIIHKDAKAMHRAMNERQDHIQQLQHEVAKLLKAEQKIVKMEQEAELYQSDIQNLRKTIQNVVNEKKDLQSDLGQSILLQENLKKENKMLHGKADTLARHNQGVERGLAEVGELNARLQKKLDAEMCSKAKKFRESGVQMLNSHSGVRSLSGENYNNQNPINSDFIGQVHDLPRAVHQTVASQIGTGLVGSRNCQSPPKVLGTISFRNHAEISQPPPPGSFTFAFNQASSLSPTRMIDESTRLQKIKQSEERIQSLFQKGCDNRPSITAKEFDLSQIKEESTEKFLQLQRIESVPSKKRLQPFSAVSSIDVTENMGGPIYQTQGAKQADEQRDSAYYDTIQNSRPISTSPQRVQFQENAAQKMPRSRGLSPMAQFNLQRSNENKSKPLRSAQSISPIRPNINETNEQPEPYSFATVTANRYSNADLGSLIKSKYKQEEHSRSKSREGHTTKNNVSRDSSVSKINTDMVRASLADLKKRLVQVRENKGADIRGDIEDYEKRKREFQSRYGMD